MNPMSQYYGRNMNTSTITSNGGGQQQQQPEEEEFGQNCPTGIPPIAFALSPIASAGPLGGSPLPDSNNGFACSGEEQASTSGGSAAIRTPSNQQQEQGPKQYITYPGPHDILCGRGPTCNDNPGNIKFRELVATRKMDYVSTISRKEKKRIAEELVRHVQTKLDPPGRFLSRVDGPECGGFSLGLDVWVECDDDIALEKTKQALRRGAASSSPPTAASAASAPAPSCFPMNTSSSEEGPASIVPLANTAAASSSSSAAKKSWPSSDDTCIEEGVTLKEWIRDRTWDIATHAERDGNVVTRIEMAYSIALAVKEQCSGMVKGDRNVGHISTNTILIRKDPQDGRSKVRISSSIIAPGPRPFETEDILVSLGHVLYELFGGGTVSSNGLQASLGGLRLSVGTDIDAHIDDTRETEEEKRSKKRRDLPHSSDGDFGVPIHDLGLPMPLSIVVSSLLRAGDETFRDRYQSVDELIGDLNLLKTNPSRYLVDNGLIPHLDVPQDSLYGRTEELSRISAVYDRVSCPDAPSEVLLLKGYSGVGKTSLAKTLAKRVAAEGGAYVSGKFDALLQTSPLSAVASGFEEFCKTFLEHDEAKNKPVRAAITTVVGSGDGRVLMELIPSLRDVIGHSNEPVSQPSEGVSGKGALNRLLFFFQKLVRAISSSAKGLVLLLDDLQWADSASLQLLLMLVTDVDSSLLLVGCYRDNEVDSDHILMAQLSKLVSAGVQLETIDVKPLTIEPINEMIADMLHLLPRLTTSLSAVVYSKTTGNALFLLRLIGTLFDEGLISYSPKARRWQWDVNAIKRKDVADDLVDLMTRKLSKLPFELRRLLALASCIGYKFEERTLALLYHGDDTDSSVETLLDLGEEEGLIYKLGSTYQWSHDQVHHAAYSLCSSENEGGALHLLIGRLLLDRSSDEEVEKNLFVIADQFSLGTTLITDHNEKIMVAQMHLRAAEKAMLAGGFVSATEYLKSGISLLEESDWTSHYEICLKLYSASAESAYAEGNLHQTASFFETVRVRGACLSDKLRAYLSYILSQGSEGELNKAIDTSIDILGQLGVCFPSEANDAAAWAAMIEVQSLLQKTPPDKIMTLDELTDINMIYALKILTLMTTYAYFGGRKQLFPIITAHMVRISLQQGVCGESSLAFSSFAIILSGIVGDYAAAYRFGKLAVALLERFDAKECTSRLYGAILGGVNHWVEPAQASLPTMLLAHEMGFSTGDVYFGCLNLSGYMLNSFLCCKELGPLAEETKSYLPKMRSYKQDLLCLMSVPIRQAALNLMGESKDPIVLSGDAMEEDSFMCEALDKCDSAVCIANTLKMMLAYLFDNHALAAELVEKTNNIEEVMMSQFLVSTHTFYAGLIQISMFRRTKDPTCRGGTWRAAAEKSIEKMGIWAKAGPWNCKHREELLQAELSFAKNGFYDEASRLYTCAIEGAHKSGFVGEEALAYERAGIAFGFANDSVSATNCLNNARDCYNRWGATRKAEFTFSAGDVSTSTAVSSSSRPFHTQ